jgi:CHASE2 domain-containing sensor protein/tRNA A-37 threonylcarbamoyl transferase component Bud32
MLQPGIYLKGRRYQVLTQLGKGGFGYTYRVSDRGQTKVLKVLIKADPKSVELFRREAQVLSQLNHPGIPKVEPDGYFEISGSEIGQSGTAHCLIMEEVPGTTLDQVIDESDEGFLEYLEALDWLKQLAEILRTIHSNNIFHRDIKPNNIIKRPDGQLALIDFGAVRERTDTFLERRAKNMTTDTRIYARGYTSPEQIEGKADYSSDFYALGRTFIYLLTGQPPAYFNRDENTGCLDWRSHASQISPSFADLLDWMMEFLPGKRPKNAGAILETITKIKAFEFGRSTVKPQIPPLAVSSGFLTEKGSEKLPIQNKFRKPIIHLIVGLCIAAALMSLRSVGILKPLEFASFDQLMRWRPPEPLDDRLLIIEIDQESLDFQASLPGQEQGSLKDSALNQALDKLLPHAPRAIGLDIYRDFAVDSSLPELQEKLSTTQVFGICLSGNGDDATTPPPDIPIDRVGFSDLALDPDNQIRRQLIGAGETENCQTQESLSFQLVMAYLEEDGFTYELPSRNELIISDDNIEKSWRSVDSSNPLYSEDDLGGFNVFINYRAVSSGDVAERISLQELLSGKYDNALPSLVQDRVVLIGNTIPQVQPEEVGGDYHSTPYGDLPGVLIHGHMVSQMLSAVQDQRPILEAGSGWRNDLWVVGWSILGSGLLLNRSRFLKFLALSAIALASFLILSWLFFINGLWLTLVYPLLGVSGPIALSLLIKATSLTRKNSASTNNLGKNSEYALSSFSQPIK